MRIAYFVHDLSDAAVHRRVRMLRPFADITLLGFRRSEQPVADVDGLVPIDLGRTVDARMGQRVAAVVRAASSGGQWQGQLAGTDVFMARQLEMLALAVLARRRIAPQAAVAFECLDIHRLMVARSAPGVALRLLEARLLRSCAMLVVSSPAFLAHHFDRYRRVPPVRLMENKVLAGELPPSLLGGIDQLRVAGPPAGPPWRIGWFGVIRCRRSLHLLADLARRLPGRIEVVIRGRVSRNVIPDFDAVVAATPGLSFLGPYDRFSELAAIYTDVHFTWAMDFYEAQLNSDWLLPNRLYEGSLHGAVPLALRSVETGRWLAARHCGVLMGEPLEAALHGYFTQLDAAGYAAARQDLATVPIADLVDDAQACAGFVAALEDLGAAGQNGRW